MIKRREFVKLAGLGVLGLAMSNYANFVNSEEKINFSHKPIKWEYASKGLDFSRIEVYRNDKLVDVIATVKINPNINKIKVFHGYDKLNVEINDIEGWQRKTGALAMINSNQYMSDPYYYPCDLVICDGEQKGPKQNKYSRGILLAEPKDLEGRIKKADLLDFNYDEFDYKTTPYTQGVQHWPILLDREGKIKVSETNWQANRTVVAKTNEDNILFMTTEGGYFTLYNFGRFLKDSNSRADKGFNIHTAMNMDGGIATNMIINTPKLDYLNNKWKERIPGVIGVFPRN